jgi:hypothetical protein
MEPVARYSERRIDGRRQFSLYPQEIVIVGKQLFGAHYEFKIPLKSLDPTISRIYTRSTFFLAGLGFGLGSFFIFGILWISFLHAVWSFWMNWVILAVGIIGSALACLTFKKVEFAQFRSQAGVRILDMARSGPEASKFDEFLKTLVERILVANQTAPKT